MNTFEMVLAVGRDRLDVECYSGHTYAQTPRAFAWRDRRYVVQEVERAWRTPVGPHFRVRTDDGSRFDLAYDETTFGWTIHRIHG